MRHSVWWARLIDSSKIVRASSIAKFMWNMKYLPQMFRTSETTKLSNKGSFMLLFNCRKRRGNLLSFLLHLTNHRSSHRLLCLTYVFNAFATIVCWDTKIFAKRYLFLKLFTRNLTFLRRKSMPYNHISICPF